MPIFDRFMAPVAIAALIGAAFTGVLAAQTRAGDETKTMLAAAVGSPVQDGAVNIARAGDPSGPGEEAEPLATAVDLFRTGLKAYSSGDRGAAVENWEEAARQGHVVAQWNLARLYLDGAGSADDRARALRHLRNIAALHDPDQPPGPHAALAVEALVEIGRLYWEGVPEAELQPSASRAARIFEHAATLYGHPRAQHYLGLMYLRGEGVKQHVGRAVRWLFLAANKSYAPSQAALGDYFWQHDNAGEYRVRGLMWLALASENAKGDDAKARFEDRYKTALTQAEPDERAKVAALVESWNARNLAAAK